MENQVLRIIEGLAQDIGTPRALAVKLLVHAGEWTQLQELRCRPQDYNDSETYWRDCVITDILRKCDLPTSVDREAAAVQTFLDCEAENCATNVRLSKYLHHGPFDGPGDILVAGFIDRWRKNVNLILGNLPDTLTPRFSGGATYADTGLLITTPDKMSSAPTLYPETRDLLPLWGETSWSRALVAQRPWKSDPRSVRGNIFFTVPKDGTKFRGCAKEASIPVSYQLAVGKLMKKRLLRIGINCEEAQDRHKEIARFSSVDDTFATIDMSNASDTVCRVLVQLLVREDWLELLNSLRAHYTRVNGKWFRLEKFSSMGNGFTFELETVIFASLARSVIADEGGDPDLVSCYGDDLIVPSFHYRSVMAALRLFGFQPNMKKTFGEGPFRESCGGDYWCGVAVRPHHIEKLPDEPHEWISLANGLRRIATAHGAPTSRWDVIRRSWFRVCDQIPSNIRRCRGPVHLGDIVLHDTPDNWSVLKNDDPTWDSVFVRAYMPIPSVLPWNHWLPTVQLACCTLGLPSTGVTPRGGISGFRIGAVNATLTTSWLPNVQRR